jgi:hypothetical protein
MKAAAVLAVAGALAGTSVTAASAATHRTSRANQVRAERQALKRELKALKSQSAGTSKAAPRDYFSDIISEIEYDLSAADIENIIGTLPVVGQYS